MYEQGQRVSVVNPLRIRGFAKSDLAPTAAGEQAITGTDASHQSSGSDARGRD